MASTCCQPITHSSADASIVKFSKPLPPYDASWFGCTPRFNLSAMGLPAPMNGHGLQALPAVGQSLQPAVGPVVDLTCDDDGDSEGGDADHTEAASGSPTNSVPLPPSSLPKSPASIADDLTTSSAAATLGQKSPWINVPKWSLYPKRHSGKSLDNLTVDTLHAGTDNLGSPSNESESAPKDSRTPVTELLESSVETNNLQRPGQSEPVVNSHNSGEAPLSTADSSGQTLALITVSASSLPNHNEAGPMTVNISNFTTTNILGKRPSPSGVDYWCELGPLWLSSDLVREMQMGGV